jgi:U3 small nucleolar RNA-associated protein 4
MSSCDIEQPEVSTTTEDSKNCTICLRYNSMLHMDFIANNEMLVVEQPWLDVVATFPAALERKVYGNQ